MTRGRFTRTVTLDVSEIDMNRNRQLTELINIGQTIAARLRSVGIKNEADLRKMGPIKAHQLLEHRYPDETLPICYYLYSFEGALKNLHWNEIGEKRKQMLKKAIR